jgi:membrane-associated phospholipid phosphatase
VLGFLAYAPILSLIYPLSLRERLLLGGLNLVAAGVIILLACCPNPCPWTAALRDWFPAALILLAYRESGLLLRPDASHHLDHLFVRWDRVLFESACVKTLLRAAAPWLQRYLELSYLFCYPLVPLGFAILMRTTSVWAARALTRAGAEAAADFARRQPPLDPLLSKEGKQGWSPAAAQIGRTRSDPTNRDGVTADHFWTTVLLATLACYAVYPFFPLTPPRVLFHDLPGPLVQPLLRKANFWILDQFGVQACIFPSGHVAAVTATALAIRAYLPRLGWLFLIAAASVAAATVYGRYHYAADAVAGAIVGVAAFLISRRIHR